LFFSKNHTWTHLEKSGIAKIGLDDLLQHLTGELKFNSLHDAGQYIKKGDLLTEVIQNEKVLKIFSPISGKIEKANVSLIENPDLINNDPYGKGWLYKMKPTNWKDETNSFYLAEEATKWESEELIRFKDFISQSLAKSAVEPSMVAMQDGGELRDNTLSELPDEVWKDFQSNFLDAV
jgi:glycine cleavage system H protein